MVAFFKLPLARGSGSAMGSLFIVFLALCSDPHLWSLFSVYLARGSGSNMGPTFKLRLVRGSGSIMGSPFKVLLVRGSDSKFCSFSKCSSRVVVVVIEYVESASVRLCKVGLDSLMFWCVGFF